MRSWPGWSFANENEITLSCAEQSPASGAMPSTPFGSPMSPAYYVMAGSVISFLVIWRMPETAHDSLR